MISLLSPSWQARIDQVKDRPLPTPVLVPRDVAVLATEIQFVTTPDDVTAFVSAARQWPVSRIGYDAEFRFKGTGVVVRAGERTHVVHDATTIVPLLFSFALVVDDGAGERVCRYVVDARVPGLARHLAPLLRLPVPFVGHFMLSDLHCLWQLGMPEPDIVWDTWVFEKAARLGFEHPGYQQKAGSTPGEQAALTEQAEADERIANDLLSVCLRHGVDFPFRGSKATMQQSFLHHADGAAFTPEQIGYAASDAEAAARLYLPQLHHAGRKGLTQHLIAVEMPWVVTTARTTWHGVRRDPEKCRQVLAAAAAHAHALGEQVRATAGITNVRSHGQLKSLFEGRGLLHLFHRRTGHTFDRERLEEVEDHAPDIIKPLRALKKVLQVSGDKFLMGTFDGPDGRVRPEFRQLGMESGRQGSRNPNVMGLGKVLRPVIVPDPGNGIGEADWSQIEVGIAAAVYGDPKLVEMFNADDVYSAMARLFFADRLTSADKALTGREFKKAHPDLRHRMKSCTLGIIYGLTPHGLALRLKCPVPEAESLLDAFLDLFPALRDALTETVASSALRGYAVSVSGLRRSRGKTGEASNWERNWMRNHPVQSSCSTLLKVAGNRLDRLYRPLRARLIMPVHDAFVFEAPLGALEAVGQLTVRVMKDVVVEHFPTLQPGVDLNISNPACWNKDGVADAVERWIADPTFRL